MTVKTTQGVTYVFTANSDDMTYSDNGQTLTIQGKAFSTSDITGIDITASGGDETANDDFVSVSYDGNAATVEVAGNVARYLTTTISGADVTIDQDSNLGSEITYQLSGASENGSFTMNGSYKATLVLNGLTLTSTNGAPMTINNGKRISVELADGTVNTLTDAANGEQSACFYVKGHAEFDGGGTLNLVGNSKHAFCSDEYTQLKKKTGIINITSATTDGMHVSQYFEMKGGTVNISGIGGDGIDVEAEDNSTDEQNGQLIISGGTLDIATTGEDVKALKADGDVNISDGSLTLTCTGNGSKAIGTKGSVNVSGGTLAATTTGGVYAEGTDDDSKPHGVKASGSITISGGEAYVACTRKAFDCDGTFAINGGKVLGIGKKSSATDNGTQGSTTESGVSVSGGQTLTYGTISYTVPAIYTNTSAEVIYSPKASGNEETGGQTSSTLADNNVTVEWNDNSATVSIAENIAGKVTATVKGAHVNLVQASDVATEITYTLSGSSSNGSLWMDGSYKATFVMNGLTLTNPDSAAVNIRDGKRINIVLATGTNNTLTDGTNGTHKACLMVKGHTEFKDGTGTLTLVGKTGHAFWSKEYVEMKKSTGTINITASKKDGMNINQYFLINGGTLNISGVTDDGIQVSYETDDDGNKSTDEENTGQVLLNGGTVNITVTEAASKGIKSEGDILMTGGSYNVTTTGNGAYDATERDAKGCAGLKSDANLPVSGGEITLKSTGTGGKCIKVDGTMTMTGGTINATSTGSQYKYSNSITASAKAIKVDGALTISGGTITASSKTHEAIESKSTLEISGGIVSATSSSDDAINSSGDFTISGGYVMGYAPGNDGLDANGNFYIKGGNIYAIGSRQPEVAIDANTEGGKKLYITGGNIVTIGPLEGGSQLTQSCYQNSSVSANTWYGLYKDGVLVMAIKTPSNTSSLGSGMVVSTSGTTTLKSGITVSGGTTIFDGMGNYDGTASGGSSVSLTSYTAQGGMGPGGGGPGGGGFGPGGGGWRW